MGARNRRYNVTENEDFQSIDEIGDNVENRICTSYVPLNRLC